MATNEQTSREKLAAFKASVAQVMVTIYKARHLRASGLSSTLRSLGIPGEVDTTSGDVKLPEIPADDGMIGSRPRSDFTAEAQEAHDTKALQKYRANVYQFLRSQHAYGEFHTDQVMKALRDLGLPEPSVVTTVHARWYAGETYVDRYGDTVPREESAYFSLPGEVEKDTIKAKLAEITPDPTASVAIRALFPEAQGLAENEPRVSTSQDLTWPEYDGK